MANANSQDGPIAEIRSDSFRQIVRRCSASVGIVTTCDGDDIYGVTCKSFTALSDSPPRLLVNLETSAVALRAIARCGALGLNILNASQEEIATRFSIASTPNSQKFKGFHWTLGRSKAPLLQHAVAALECSVEEIIERHSHALVICHVTRWVMSDDMSALVYWNGQYRDVHSNDDLVLLGEMSGL